jgi:hypothetical protein
MPPSERNLSPELRYCTAAANDYVGYRGPGHQNPSHFTSPPPTVTPHCFSGRFAPQNPQENRTRRRRPPPVVVHRHPRKRKTTPTKPPSSPSSAAPRSPLLRHPRPRKRHRRHPPGRSAAAGTISDDPWNPR